MGVYLVHHPLHNFSPEVGGGRLHGNGRLQGTLQYCLLYFYYVLVRCVLNTACGITQNWTHDMLIFRNNSAVCQIFIVDVWVFFPSNIKVYFLLVLTGFLFIFIIMKVVFVTIIIMAFTELLTALYCL